MTIDVLAITKLMLLLMLANGAPVIGKKILAERWTTPLDFGLILPDGHPVFGRSKTIRGILLSIATTSAAAPFVGLDWIDGAVIATAAMLGDLISSFTKRRMGLASSSKATGIDQIPESLLPAIAARSALDLSYLDIAVAVLVFIIGEIVLSRILYRLKLRDRPY